MSADQEMLQWMEDARKACAKAGVEAPAENILESMFDAGLEPEQTADPEERLPYERKPRPRHKTVADVSEIIAAQKPD